MENCVKWTRVSSKNISMHKLFTFSQYKSNRVYFIPEILNILSKYNLSVFFTNYITQRKRSLSEEIPLETYCNEWCWSDTRQWLVNSYDFIQRFQQIQRDTYLRIYCKCMEISDQLFRTAKFVTTMISSVSNNNEPSCEIWKRMCKAVSIHVSLTCQCTS